MDRPRFWPWPESGSRLVKRSALWTAALLVLLEIWRPYYFLTDDNLSGGLPFLTAMGRHLHELRAPVSFDYLLGGHYPLLRDPTYFGCHPWVLLCSLLADTPGRFAMLDLISIPEIFLGALGFAALAATLKEEFRLRVGEGRLLFYTLSFTFSTFVLTVGASWSPYLVNQAALPWLVLGLWRRDARASFALVALASLHQMAGGHLAGLIENTLAVGLFAVGVALYRRRWQPLMVLAAGQALSLLAVLPVLWPCLEGFGASARGAGRTSDWLGTNAMPAVLFPLSLFFGNFTKLLIHFAGGAMEDLPFPKLPTLLACAASWCLIPALLGRGRWRFLESFCLGMIVFLAVMIVRPVFITEAMTHVPILRSMRWPFREILQFQLFLHLLLVLRSPAGSRYQQNLVAASSLGAFLLPLPFARPPALNELLIDRGLVLSGRADLYWATVKAHLQPGDRIATVIGEDDFNRNWRKLSYVLAGTADFPELYRVPCISGYSTTMPRDQLPLGVAPVFWFGAFSRTQQAEIMRRDPHLQVVVVEQIDPLKISLVSGRAPPVQLVPARP